MKGSANALVTGSTDGLGSAVARSLVTAGFLVLVHGRIGQRAGAHRQCGLGVTANCLYPATCMDPATMRESGVKPLTTVAEGSGRRDAPRPRSRARRPHR